MSIELLSHLPQQSNWPTAQTQTNLSIAIKPHHWMQVTFNWLHRWWYWINCHRGPSWRRGPICILIIILLSLQHLHHFLHHLHHLLRVGRGGPISGARSHCHWLFCWWLRLPTIIRIHFLLLLLLCNLIIWAKYHHRLQTLVLVLPGWLLSLNWLMQQFAWQTDWWKSFFDKNANPIHNWQDFFFTE